MARQVKTVAMICKTFLLTNAIVVPVGLTVTDEVGLPYLVKGVSMRVRLEKVDGSLTQLSVHFTAQFQPSCARKEEEVVAQ